MTKPTNRILAVLCVLCLLQFVVLAKLNAEIDELYEIIRLQGETILKLESSQSAPDETTSKPKIGLL